MSLERAASGETPSLSLAKCGSSFSLPRVESDSQVSAGGAGTRNAHHGGAVMQGGSTMPTLTCGTLHRALQFQDFLEGVPSAATLGPHMEQGLEAIADPYRVASGVPRVPSLDYIRCGRAGGRVVAPRVRPRGVGGRAGGQAWGGQGSSGGCCASPRSTA